jgi:hypothetical protein
LILIDQFHVTILAPPGRPETTYEAIARRLSTRRFQAELRQAITAVIRRHPPLRAVRLRVTR